MGNAGQSDSYAVIAIGFKDGNKKNQSGYVLCEYSWGPSDQKGTENGRETYVYFWLPYSYATDFMAIMDFWMMEVSEFPSKL